MKKICQMVDLVEVIQSAKLIGRCNYGFYYFHFLYNGYTIEAKRYVSVDIFKKILSGDTDIVNHISCAESLNIFILMLAIDNSARNGLSQKCYDKIICNFSANEERLVHILNDIITHHDLGLIKK